MNGDSLHYINGIEVEYFNTLLGYKVYKSVIHCPDIYFIYENYDRIVRCSRIKDMFEWFDEKRGKEDETNIW